MFGRPACFAGVLVLLVLLVKQAGNQRQASRRDAFGRGVLKGEERVGGEPPGESPGNYLLYRKQELKQSPSVVADFFLSSSSLSCVLNSAPLADFFLRRLIALGLGAPVRDAEASLQNLLLTAARVLALGLDFGATMHLLPRPLLLLLPRLARGAVLLLVRSSFESYNWCSRHRILVAIEKLFLEVLAPHCLVRETTYAT